MLVTGAMGMAQEVLEVLVNEQGYNENNLCFFDNVNPDSYALYNRFKILKTFEQAADYFKTKDVQFTLGLGHPKLREMMATKFADLGGRLVSVVSNKAHIGSFETVVAEGCQIMQGVIITNNVHLGKGVLVNLNSTISHDSVIGDFTEIACNVTIPGRCKIGNRVFIGSNATINPDITIGDNVIIGAGAVVLKNIPANSTVAGNPAKPLTK
ncbi:MAG: hexapeptide transferase [Pusillimonas sp.]|nr:hexapeptide transferase [Pusillimonas sp.]|tara:strand:- start:6661 stop:7293 length:633 start_codon:yes stop_codon:yes gene_type:complete